MMKKLFLMCTAFATQYFAPQLEVRGVGGDSFQVETAIGSTEAAVCEAIYLIKPDIPPKLIRLVFGAKILDPRSSEIFPTEVTSVGFVKLSTDCMVQFKRLMYIRQTTILITSDKFSGGCIKISAPASSEEEFRDELRDKLFLKDLVLHLSALYQEGRFAHCEDLILNYRLYLEICSRYVIASLNVMSLPRFEDWLYFAIAYGDWFGKNTTVDIRDFTLFHDLFRDLFSALQSINYPEIEWIRKEIHSQTLEKFPEETPEVLKLLSTPRKESINRTLRQAKLLPT